MRKLSFAIVPQVAISMMAFINITPLPIGSILPKGDTKVKDISGKETTLLEVKKEKGLLVMFCCNTCPYVVKNQQRTNAICSYAQKMNVGVILLNSNEANRKSEDSYSAMKEYAKKVQYNWIYAVDEKHLLADVFGASKTPECYLFDKDLILVYHGAIDNNPGEEENVTRRHLQIAIDELIAGKEVSIKETRSVGCGIKRLKS